MPQPRLTKARCSASAVGATAFADLKEDTMATLETPTEAILTDERLARFDERAPRYDADNRPRSSRPGGRCRPARDRREAPWPCLHLASPPVCRRHLDLAFPAADLLDDDLDWVAEPEDTSATPAGERGAECI